MGSMMVSLFLDCEALANRANITEIPDTNFFGYIASIAAAERCCVEQFGPEVWAEADDHTSLAAGSERLDLISQFVTELDASVGGEIDSAYRAMESTFTEEIGNRLTQQNNPWGYYRDAIDAAEIFWVELVTEAGLGDDNVDAENRTEQDTETLVSSDVEDRLDRTKSLFEKGAISELEYQRQRQRILDEI